MIQFDVTLMEPITLVDFMGNLEEYIPIDSVRLGNSLYFILAVAKEFNENSIQSEEKEVDAYIFKASLDQSESMILSEVRDDIEWKMVEAAWKCQEISDAYM